jgi:hypothetical protein
MKSTASDPAFLCSLKASPCLLNNNYIAISALIT